MKEYSLEISRYYEMFHLLNSIMNGIKVDYRDINNWEWILSELDKQVCLSFVSKLLLENAEYFNEIGCKYFVNKAISSLATNIQVTHIEKEVVSILNVNNVPFVIIKGSAAAVYYAEPSLRPRGDIDIIVKPEYLDAAIEALLQNGYIITSGLSSDKRHIQLMKNKIEVEVHQRFFTITSGETGREDFVLYHGIDHRVFCAIDSYNVPLLPHEENGMVLLQHMKQHLAHGMGLRQLLDWIMFAKNICDDGFWLSGYGNRLRELKLDAIAKSATKIGKQYFGLSGAFNWCDDANDKVNETFMRYLLIKGNFGRGVSSCNDGVATVLSHDLSLIGWAKYLQRQGSNKLQKSGHSIFLHFSWLYQIAIYIKNVLSRSDGVSFVSQIFEAKRRKSMFKALAIDKNLF